MAKCKHGWKRTGRVWTCVKCRERNWDCPHCRAIVKSLAEYRTHYRALHFTARQAAHGAPPQGE
jgi:hypothetical protein